MASNQDVLTETLTPALLAQLRTFWFDHIYTDDGHILPIMEDQMRWFKKDEQFDHVCAIQFKPALETILASGATAPDILAAVDTSIALNWVSLILLLDQIPRNCYRGAASKTVFTRFDPLALGVALEADACGITTLSPDVRWRIAYRTWFHLPLMHSEELGVHEQAVRMHGETMEDFRRFLAKSPAEVSEEERGCWEVLKQREGEVMERLEMMLSFEVRHKAIIERFGRYPHRNGSMGRETTAEETDYLENGGETFG